MSSNFPELSVLKRVKFFNLFKEGPIHKNIFSVWDFLFYSKFYSLCFEKKAVRIEDNFSGFSIAGECPVLGII